MIYDDYFMPRRHLVTYIWNFHWCSQISGKRLSHVFTFLWFQSACSCHWTGHDFRRRAKYVISTELLGLGIWYLLLTLCVRITLHSPTQFTLLCYLRYWGRFFRRNAFVSAEWYLTNSIHRLLRCNATTGRKTNENKNIVVRMEFDLTFMKYSYIQSHSEILI